MTASSGEREQSLQQAFATFNQFSAQLTEAYEALQGRVTELTAELKAARAARLRELEEKERLGDRLARLIEALPGGVLVLDGAGRVIENNPTAAAWLGTDLHGRPLDMLLAAIGADAARQPGELQLPDGRVLALASRPLETMDGRLLLITDVTETRRLQALAERRERVASLGETSARLAHQIRTPLSTALLYASSLRRRGGYGDATDGLLNSLRSIEQMINDMLIFAGGGHDTADQVDIADLCAQVQETFLPQLQDGQRLAVSVAPAIGRISGNAASLAGALGNLVANALAAAGSQAYVCLEARPVEDSHCELRVTDNGPGIASADRARIFDPFFTTRSQGTGLGLAVVRSVAQAHGGDVRVECDTETRFILRLPRSEQPGFLPSGKAHAQASQISR